MVLGRPVFMDHDPVSRRLQDMDDQQLLSLAEALFCADNDYDLGKLPHQASTAYSRIIRGQ
jgi:hypothetical protein